mmetsp:Transcript_18875/g.32273  ORF Transcript_18875/g.32273 Transcript_18875/m.32273 type:complete len:90 (-) Transcript_18875:946-1215(-)
MRYRPAAVPPPDLSAVQVHRHQAQALCHCLRGTARDPTCWATAACDLYPGAQPNQCPNISIRPCSSSGGLLYSRPKEAGEIDPQSACKA